MVKIQLNLTNEENKIVSLYKVKNNLIKKTDAIKEIIQKEGKK